MTPNHLTRFAQALMLATIVAALAVPTVALAGVNSGYGPRDGWYTYAISVTKSDRSAASESNRYGPYDGWYGYALSLTNSAKVLTADGRSPDTLDAAQAAQLQAIDGRSPDTIDAVSASQLQVADGRSPDTLDAVGNTQAQIVDGRSPDTLNAASGYQPIETVTARSFDWADAGIGATFATMMIALIAGAMLLLGRVHRRQRVQAT